MSSWKRGFLEIIAEILESLMANPLKKTHITFRCNLDSRAVTKYLSVMMYVGLVEKSTKDPSYFVITEKGIDYRNHRAGWGIPGGVFVEEGLRSSWDKEANFDVQYGQD